MELFSDAGSIPAISTIDNGVGYHQDTPRHYHLTDRWRRRELKATVPSSSLAVFGKHIRLVCLDLTWRLLLSPKRRTFRGPRLNAKSFQAKVKTVRRTVLRESVDLASVAGWALLRRGRRRSNVRAASHREWRELKATVPSSSLAVFGRHIRLVCLDLTWRLLLSPKRRTFRGPRLNA